MIFRLYLPSTHMPTAYSCAFSLVFLVCVHISTLLQHLVKENRELKQRLETSERINRDLKKSVYTLSYR